MVDVYKDNRVTLFLKFNFIITLFFIIWTLTPYLSRNGNQLIPFILVIMWIISALMHIKINAIKVRGLYILIHVIVWQIWIYLLKLSGYSSAIWGNFFYESLFYFSFFIFYFYTNYTSEYVRKKLTIYMLVIIAINILDNIRLNILFPDASSLINFEWGTKFIAMNVGTTTFVNVVVMVLVSSLTIFINNNHVKLKILAIFIIIISYIYIFLSGRVTAISISILFTFIILIYSRISKLKSKDKILILISIILLIPIIVISIKSMLIHIVPFIKNERIAIRLYSIIEVFNGGFEIDINSSSFSSRIYLAKISLGTFIDNIRNFIFGVGYHKFSSVQDTIRTGIGQHSELIDILAKYGLLGGYFVYSILYEYNKQICKDSNSEYLKTTLVYLVFIIISLTNNSFNPEMGIIIGILIPNIILFINQDKIGGKDKCYQTD